jgi:uncharacterized membrane-anchored protein
MKEINSKSKDILYWVTILSACTMGETAGDYLSFGLELGYGWASIILTILLTSALLLEAFSKGLNEIRYWLTIVIMSTTGTAFADFITRTMKFGYGWGSAFLITLFILIFISERFFRSQKLKTNKKNAELEYQYKQINIHHKNLPETNVFYWASILVASTFGTTMGDFVSDVINLEFDGRALLLFSLLIIVLIIEYRSKSENKLFYWTALVIASTIGANTGDYLTKPDALDLGYLYGSAILISVFCIIFLIRTRLILTKAGI